MFTIIGGDGREYGPASADQIRAWISSGRANLDTKAKAVGSDEWRRLGDFAEFTGAATTPPPIPTAPIPSEPGIPVAYAPAPVARPRIDTDLADRGARLLAWFIDNVIAFIACLPGIVVIALVTVQALISGGDIEDAGPARNIIGGVLIFFGLAIVLGIQAWMLTTRGQTIGKRLMSVRIVRFSDNANPGFAGAVVMRAVIPAVIGAVPLLGGLFAIVDACFIFRDDRRCIHDLIAGTKVIRA